MYTNFHCYTKVKWHDLNKTPNGNQTAFHAEAAGSTAATEDPINKPKTRNKGCNSRKYCDVDVNATSNRQMSLIPARYFYSYIFTRKTIWVNKRLVQIYR